MSACFALPFERRLVLGTEDGRILLVNYVTGAILDESHPHTVEVSTARIVHYRTRWCWPQRARNTTVSDHKWFFSFRPSANTMAIPPTPTKSPEIIEWHVQDGRIREAQCLSIPRHATFPCSGMCIFHWLTREMLNMDATLSIQRCRQDRFGCDAYQVTQLAYCKDTKTIISVDYQGSAAVTSEIQCKLKEVCIKCPWYIWCQRGGTLPNLLDFPDVSLWSRFTKSEWAINVFQCMYFLYTMSIFLVMSVGALNRLRFIVSFRILWSRIFIVECKRLRETIAFEDLHTCNEEAIWSPKG